jgi:phosphoglycerate dehydrogenase-like enzyme
MSERAILLYHPSAEEARAYADRVSLPRRDVVLQVASTPGEAMPRLADTEILYAWGFPSALLARMRRLRWIQVMGAGVEPFLGPGLPRAVTVTRAAGIFGPWMAEYTLGWCLWVTQRMEAVRAAQRARRWEEVPPRRLRGATLCVVGLGDIGQTIARAARAFGMTVIGVSRAGGRGSGVQALHRPPALRLALARADFVVVTVPLTRGTRGLIGARALSAMKPTAWLINIARGPVVDEAALVDALEKRRIGGAVLDVFATEPLPPAHPLWGLDNAVITPHIAGPSTPEEIAPIFNDNLRRYCAGRPLRHEVNRRRGY